MTPGAQRDTNTTELDTTWIDEAAAANHDEAVDTRRWLHARPEVSFAEHETSAAIEQRLRELGLDPEPCPTETGAVASLDGGRPGRTILVRADIDALPVTEETDIPFASQHEGRMHACGHDAHTAILLSTIRAMAARAEDLPGRYVFVFQPAEEQVAGAQAMLDGGLLEEREVDACIGLHVTPQLPLGYAAMKPGISMAANTGFRITLRGDGGHGAMASRDGNVVLALGALVPKLPGIVTGMAHEGTGCACSTGMVHAGTAPNVVPQHATIEGTLRTFTDEHTTAARAALAELCDTTAADFGVRAEIEITMDTPAVDNDPAATATVRGATEALLGPDHVFPLPPTTPSDDMSLFLQRAPGCYFYVGAGSDALRSGPHHSATFAIDEGCLDVGTRSLLAGALALAATP